MKKINPQIILLIVPILFFLIFNCSIPQGGSSGGGDGGNSGETSFWVRRADGTNSFYQINAQLLYSGSKCLIYVDESSLGQVSKTTAAIGSEFDSNIYLDIINYFGSEGDQDSNGKVIILILDIIDGFSGSGGYVAGYFDAIHLYSKESYPVSNEADMIFMDCYPGTPGNSTFYSTIAHEFQHLINYNVNVFLETGIAQNTWINEGLSSAAETIYNGINNDKVNYFNTNVEVKNGTYFVKWSNNLANYSTVYLFFQWLRIQASNGNNIFKIINDDLDNDFQAIEDAASTYLYGGTATGWKNIFRDWLIAIFCNDSVGIYGYKGTISTTPQNFASAGVKSLEPGGAVYKDITTDFNGSASGNIDYVGLTDSSSIDTSNPYSGDYLISYNANSDESSGSENTTSLPSTSILSASKMSFDLTTINTKEQIYPIDFIFDPKDK